MFLAKLLRSLRSYEFIVMLFSGMAVTLSLAPFNAWPLSFVGLAALYHCIQQSDLRKACLNSLIFACGLFFSGCYWVYISMNSFGGAAMPLALLMTCAFCGFIALLLPPFVYCYKRFFYSNNALVRCLNFAALWFFSEWLRTWFLTGFPWMFVGYSQTEGPLNSWAPIIGTLGLGVMIAFVSASAMELLYALKNKALSLPSYAIIALITTIFLSPLYLQTIEWTKNKSPQSYQVAMIQPNVDLLKKWHPQFLFKDMEYHRHTTNDLADADIVVWPETAVAQLYHQVGYFLDTVDRESTKRNTAVILGLPSQWEFEDRHVFHNSMIGIGKADGIYHKQKLVPFGEYVPFANQLRGLIEFFDLPLSEFLPGPPNQSFLTAHGLKIMPYICYEIVYPDFVAATAGEMDILVTVSNDAWFGNSIGPIQHLQMAQMRALETGRYILRGTNTGVTAIIDPYGKIVEQLPQFERGVLKGTVFARKGLTPVSRYGSLPSLIFCSMILLTGLILRRMNDQTIPKIQRGEI